jgi:hypothetical protein
MFNASSSGLFRKRVQAVRYLLRRLVAYGNTNKYRPVNSSKASGSSGE